MGEPFRPAGAHAHSASSRFHARLENDSRSFASRRVRYSASEDFPRCDHLKAFARSPRTRATFAIAKQARVATTRRAAGKRHHFVGGGIGFIEPLGQSKPSAKIARFSSSVSRESSSRRSAAPAFTWAMPDSSAPCSISIAPRLTRGGCDQTLFAGLDGAGESVARRSERFLVSAEHRKSAGPHR